MPQVSRQSTLSPRPATSEEHHAEAGESEAEIQRALYVGNYEAAVNTCLQVELLPAWHSNKHAVHHRALCPSRMAMNASGRIEQTFILADLSVSRLHFDPVSAGQPWPPLSAAKCVADLCAQTHLP